MGCWGIGINQTDEYCEVFERFMEEYDEGKPLSDIKKDILDEYFEEFDKKDPILHDVYFAIGKAEWMCGGISAEIYETISNIINSGENIKFYRELEASENDLKKRQKILIKFLTTLSTPRGKTKKRKIPTEKYIKIEKPKLPPFKSGDIFAYKVEEKYKLLSLISRSRFADTYASQCFVWEKMYDEIPSIDALTNEYIRPIGYFTIATLPDMKKFIYVGNNQDLLQLNIPLHPYLIHTPWKPVTWRIVNESHLLESLPSEYYMKFSDCLDIINRVRTKSSS